MSMPPSASLAAATNSSPPAASLTSHTSGVHRGPMAAAASSIRARSRPQMATAAPSPCSALAVPNPKPLDAAATAARLPEIPSSMAGHRRSGAQRLDRPSRHATDEHAGPDGAIDDCAGGDDAAGSDRDAGQDRRPGADPGSTLDLDRPPDVPTGPLGRLADLVGRREHGHVVAEVHVVFEGDLRVRVEPTPVVDEAAVADLEAGRGGGTTTSHPEAATEAGTGADAHAGEAQHPYTEAAEGVAGQEPQHGE